jgi:putative addiction module CopG family antidote
MSTDFLPSDLSQFVKGEVASGQFASEEQVVIEGVRLLQAHKKKLEQLRADIRLAEEQFERGEYTEYDLESLREFFDEVKREGRRHYEASQLDGGRDADRSK